MILLRKGLKMSGRKSRQKGNRGEREFAEVMGFERNARIGQDSEDIKVPEDCPFVYEVKRYKKNFTSVYKAIEQAQGYDKTRIPVAAMRDDHQQWLVALPLGSWLLLTSLFKQPIKVPKTSTLRQRSDVAPCVDPLPE